jgi:hypothetical protein
MKTAPPDAPRPDPPRTKSALIAIVVLVAGVYRTLEAYCNRPAESKLLPPGTLARLPLELGDWRGEDQPLDQRTIEATDTDQSSRLHPPRSGRPCRC